MPDSFSTQVQRTMAGCWTQQPGLEDAVGQFELQLCTLHRGVAAVTIQSAAASLLGLFMELGLPGHHMVVSHTLPHMLLTQIEQLSKCLRVEVSLVKTAHRSDWEAAINPQTRLLISSDHWNAPNLATIGALGQTHHIVSCVDVSNDTAYWCDPFAQGVGLALYSDLGMLAGVDLQGSAWVESGLMRWDTPPLAERYAHAPCLDGLDTNSVTPISASLRAHRYPAIGGPMDPSQAAVASTGLHTLRLRLDHLQTNRNTLAALLKQTPPLTPGRTLKVDLRALHSDPAAIAVMVKTLRKRLRYTQVHPTELPHELELTVGLQATEDVRDEMIKALAAAGKALEDTPANPLGSLPHSKAIPPRPVVICLHGAGHNRQVWASTEQRLRQAGWTTVALDCPGHGAASGAGSQVMRSIHEYANWLDGYIKAHHPQPVVVMGHSMGSLIALRWAALASGHAAGLILMSTAYPMTVSDEILNHAHQPSEALCSTISQWCLAPQHRPGFDAGPSPLPGVHLVNEGVRMMQRLPKGVLHGDFYACHTYDTGLDDATTVHCPVLLISGEHDVMTPVKHLGPLLSTLGNRVAMHTESRWLPDCGHMPMIESADASAQAVIKFLSQL